MNVKPTAKTSEILIQELEDELLIYNLKTNQAYCLNETSAMIYQICDGTKTVAEMSDSMSRKLKTLVSEDLVWLALNELRKDGLLENDAQLNIHFAGFSRREMVRKIGLAFLIALPVVSSIIAPGAAMAASAALPPTAACSTDSQCSSGSCVVCFGGLCGGCEITPGAVNCFCF